MFLGDGGHGWRSTSSNYHLDGLGKQCDNSCRYAQGCVRDSVIGYFELFEKMSLTFLLATFQAFLSCYTLSKAKKALHKNTDVMLRVTGGVQ